MTCFKFRKKHPSVSHIIDENGKENQIDAKPSFTWFFKQLAYMFQYILLYMVSLIVRMDQKDLLKIISMVGSLCPTIDSTSLFPIEKVMDSLKKAMYNIHFPPLDQMQHFKIHSLVNFIERKIKDSDIIGKHCEGRKCLTSEPNECESPNTLIDFPYGKKWGAFNVTLSFLFGKGVPKFFPAFGTFSNCRDTEYQVVEPCIVLQVLKHVFELIANLEELVQNFEPEIVHSKIATHILRGWNNGCIPRVGVTLKYFLAFFIESLGIYVNACFKETKANSQGDPKSDEEGTDKPIDKQQARARVPAMTKAGLKEHMASLRQMWCQEFSAGLAEDLLSQEQQQDLRRFGKEQGLKQYEIDNILNASSASLKEKGHALMDDWQHGRGGSIVRRGKQLQQEHFEETLKALSSRDRNSRKDKESKPPFPPDSDC